MTLAASGEISIGGSTANRSINLELNRSASASSNLNETDLRTLAGKAGSGTTISLSDFYNKSWVNLSTVPGASYSFAGAGTVSINLKFLSDGTWEKSGSGTSTTTGTWGPTSGTGFWIRFTETANNGSGGTWTVPSGWNELTTTRQISGSRTSIGAHDKTFTIEVSSSSTGSPVLSTRTGVILSIERT